MNKVSLKLAVIFEKPFWVGIVEILIDEKISVSKITFGKEPKNEEIQIYILNNFKNMRFSSTSNVKVITTKVNPKRQQRLIKKEISVGIGTKSQQLLKLQYEERKFVKKENLKLKSDLEKQRKFDLKQQKKKQKHRGSKMYPLGWTLKKKSI